MNTRRERAKQILAQTGNISQFDTDKFKVRSPTNPDQSYVVSETERLWE